MWKLAIFVVLLAVVTYILVTQVIRFDLMVHHHKQYPGQCKEVKGAKFGSENFQVTSDGQAFVTSGINFVLFGEQFKTFFKENNVRGRMLLFDLIKPETGAVELKIVPSKTFDLQIFHPHGISLLEDKTKKYHLLYVVNHRDGKEDSVEKFRFNPKTKELQHVKTFTSEKLRITNDLAVVEEDRFYISNNLYYKDHLWAHIESVLGLPYGGILYFNGADFTEVASSLIGPNGLTMSADNRFLYTAMPTSKGMLVYNVQADRSLQLVQTVPLQTMPDNFHLSQETGDVLYAGCHPVVYHVLGHLGDPRARAPSQVLRIPLGKNGTVDSGDITQVFYDHGDLITASTVAVTYKNKLLIGSLLDTMVMCDSHF